MTQRLSRGDDSDTILTIPFQVYNDNNGVLHKPDANPPVLTIILTVVKTGKHGMSEYINGIGESNTMFAYVLSVFRLIPLELHINSVYTLCGYVKSEFTGLSPPDIG